jgi:hypothetical protein
VLSLAWAREFGLAGWLADLMVVLSAVVGGACLQATTGCSTSASHCDGCRWRSLYLIGVVRRYACGCNASLAHVLERRTTSRPSAVTKRSSPSSANLPCGRLLPPRPDPTCVCCCSFVRRPTTAVALTTRRRVIQGGGSISNHLVMPHSRGLFARAILESSSMAPAVSQTMASAEDSFLRLAKHAGCTERGSGEAEPSKIPKKRRWLGRGAEHDDGRGGGALQVSRRPEKRLRSSAVWRAGPPPSSSPPSSTWRCNVVTFTRFSSRGRP